MSAGYNPSPFLVNILDLQNFNSNITGLSPFAALSNSVSNIQQMVNFDQKRIFVNTISRFDTTPITITDDVNLCNADLYKNGVLFTSGSGTTTTGGTVSISSGTNSIFVTSVSTGTAPAIGFQTGGRTVFSFDSQGRALYYDPSGTGTRFWISSANLIADRVQFGGTGLGAASGKVLTAVDTTGSALWNYVSSIQAGTSLTAISSGGVFFRTLNEDAGRIDSRRNWYLGNPSLSGNNDLLTSNDVTVVGGRLRYQGGGTPVVGAYLMVDDALGNLKISTMAVGPSSFIIGDQIQSGGINVRANETLGAATITGGSVEIARFVSSGRLGLLNSAPDATLDVAGNTIFRGDFRLSTIQAVQGYVLTDETGGGDARWNAPSRLFVADSAQEFRLLSNTFQYKLANGSEIVRMSTGGTLYGVNGSYDLDVNGFVAASGFSSRSPLRFFLGKTSEVFRVNDNGFMGINTSSPTERLHVVGNIYGSGTLAVAGSAQSLSLTTGSAIVTGGITAGSFTGNGANITNINTFNVGSGSNRLDIFQTDTRANIQSLSNYTTGLSNATFSTFEGFYLYGPQGVFSTLSSYIQTTSNSLSTQIGIGASAEISSFSTQMGFAFTNQFSTLSSYIINNTVQFSTLSSQSAFYASTIARVTASTLDSYQKSTFQGTGFQFGSTATLRFASSVGALAAGYKATGDLSGAIDVNGLIYASGFRGIRAPLGIGVGQSTTATLNAGGITSGQGWKLGIQGDVDISGNLYRNGILYNINGLPELYWTRTPGQSNIYFNDGGVGIGVTYPSYPLDVAGKIRCYGVDVIPGPGPITSTGQGVYVSPWLYQGSNIYYNGGGVGIGTGLSSVSTSIHLDISGSVRQRNGRVYYEPQASSFGLGYKFGASLRGTMDISGDIWARRIEVAETGTFGGRVTANDFLSLSDRRLKKEIQLLSNPWALLEPIRGYKYQWKDSGVEDIGVIAQDVMKTMPQCVAGDVESGFTVAYDKLVPLLVECVRDLRKEVDQLNLRLSQR